MNLTVSNNAQFNRWMQWNKFSFYKPLGSQAVFPSNFYINCFYLINLTFPLKLFCWNISVFLKNLKTHYVKEITKRSKQWLDIGHWPLKKDFARKIWKREIWKLTKTPENFIKGTPNNYWKIQQLVYKDTKFLIL